MKPMQTIIKIAVVSVLALFAIVGLVSISKAAEVGKMYEDCIKFKNQSFEPTDLGTYTCATIMGSLIQSKIVNCAMMTGVFEKEDEGGQFIVSWLANQSALRFGLQIEPYVLSFLNWAEKNPDHWSEDFFFMSNEWPTNDMRCNPAIRPE
jgi:hypothetical protein